MTTHHPSPVSLMQKVDSETIDDALSAHAVVIIHFWASWNTTDPQMHRLLSQVVANLPFAVHRVACDVDDPRSVELCQRAGMANVPYLAVFVEGKLQRGLVGLRSADELRTELTAAVTPSENLTFGDRPRSSKKTNSELRPW